MFLYYGGAGIAKTIKSTFPEAFNADQKTKRGDRAKLGNFTYANIIHNNQSLIIINAYIQFTHYGTGVEVDYGAIRDVFKKLKIKFTGKRFGFPLIGAGLAGGDWKIISKIIDTELQGEDFTLVEYAI